MGAIPRAGSGAHRSSDGAGVSPAAGMEARGKSSIYILISIKLFYFVFYYSAGAIKASISPREALSALEGFSGRVWAGRPRGLWFITKPAPCSTKERSP